MRIIGLTETEFFLPVMLVPDPPPPPGPGPGPGGDDPPDDNPGGFTGFRV